MICTPNAGSVVRVQLGIRYQSVRDRNHIARFAQRRAGPPPDPHRRTLRHKRARHMRAGVERLSKEMGQPKWYEILQAVVKAMAPYARHGVNVNVDFYSGVVYHLLGIERDLFVPIFAIGRVPGWVVQVLEQQDNNILIRPLTLYNGPEARTYRPIAERGR